MAVSARAQETDPGKLLSEAGSKSGLQEQQLEVVVGNVIYGLLGFLGTLFLVLIIFAGVSWMTAGGNEEKVKKAQSMIRNSTIGLVVVILSYFITAFVIQLLIESGA